MAALILTATLVLGTHPDVVQIERLAAPEYVEAIDEAIAQVDPDGLRPWWRDELLRICKRESWCGHFGPVGVHEIDGWTGVGAWAGAVQRGYLNPEQCEEHRLTDYMPVIKYLARKGSKAKSRRKRERLIELSERVAVLPTGTYTATDFATRGGWGNNAARGLRLLPGDCVPPTALDNPHRAALVAAKTIASCKQWVGPKGHRKRRECSCADHARRWAGAGRFDDRSLFGQWKSVKRQCGEIEAGRHVFQTVAVWLGMLFPRHA